MRDALKIIIFCLIIGTISSGLIVGVNNATVSRIKRNEEIKLKTAVLDVLNIDHSEGDVLKTYEENVRIISVNGLTIYKGKDGAIAFEFSGPGVWGNIHGIMSLNPDLETIRRIRILRQEETPGLGARIASKEYLDQFAEKEAYNGTSVSSATKRNDGGQEYIITGATYSSRAFINIISSAIKQVKDVMR